VAFLSTSDLRRGTFGPFQQRLQEFVPCFARSAAGSPCASRSPRNPCRVEEPDGSVTVRFSPAAFPKLPSSDDLGGRPCRSSPQRLRRTDAGNCRGRPCAFLGSPRLTLGTRRKKLAAGDHPSIGPNRQRSASESSSRRSPPTARRSGQRDRDSFSNRDRQGRGRSRSSAEARGCFQQDEGRMAAERRPTLDQCRAARVNCFGALYPVFGEM
jgi:hypothetical protein